MVLALKEKRLRLLNRRSGGFLFFFSGIQRLFPVTTPSNREIRFGFGGNYVLTIIITELYL